MTTELVIPANGQYTDNGRPKGFSSLTPFVALKDPRAALDFYTDVFGARVINSTDMGEGIMHAELDFGCGRLQLGVAQETYHLIPVDPDDEDSQFSLGICVPNVDHVIESAVARGATLREAVVGFVSGRSLREHPPPVRDQVVGNDARGGSQRRGIGSARGRMGKRDGYRNKLNNPASRQAARSL